MARGHSPVPWSWAPADTLPQARKMTPGWRFCCNAVVNVGIPCRDSSSATTPRRLADRAQPRYILADERQQNERKSRQPRGARRVHVPRVRPPVLRRGHGIGALARALWAHRVLGVRPCPVRDAVPAPPHQVPRNQALSVPVVLVSGADAGSAHAAPEARASWPLVPLRPLSCGDPAVGSFCRPRAGGYMRRPKPQLAAACHGADCDNQGQPAPERHLLSAGHECRSFGTSRRRIAVSQCAIETLESRSSGSRAPGWSSSLASRRQGRRGPGTATVVVRVGPELPGRSLPFGRYSEHLPSDDSVSGLQRATRLRRVSTEGPFDTAAFPGCAKGLCGVSSFSVARQSVELKETGHAARPPRDCPGRGHLDDGNVVSRGAGAGL